MYSPIFFSLILAFLNTKNHKKVEQTWSYWETTSYRLQTDPVGIKLHWFFPYQMKSFLLKEFLARARATFLSTATIYSPKWTWTHQFKNVSKASECSRALHFMLKTEGTWQVDLKKKCEINTSLLNQALAEIPCTCALLPLDISLVWHLHISKGFLGVSWLKQ